MDRPQESEGDSEFVGSKGVVRKDEFVRVLTEALYSLGYSQTGRQLEEESGISLHSSEVRLFKQQILDCRWDESIATLHQIGQMDETSIKLVSSVILERKFFQLLAGEKIMDALHTLRNQITPLGVDVDTVCKLSSFILLPSQILDLHGPYGQESTMNSGKRFLDELKTLLPPSVWFPENRLVHLVEQGIEFQNDMCWLHNTPSGKMSLLAHEDCGMDQIPNHTVQVLQEHIGEVWFLKFSHNGKYLASSCSECLVIIWEVNVDGQVSLKHRLSGHEKPVSYISWSHDDNQLLTCGEEETVKRWDVASGECQHTYEISGRIDLGLVSCECQHTYEINGRIDLGLVSCEWAPDGKSIYSGVNDKRIIMWDPEGNLVECLPTHGTMRIADLRITSDGKQLITVCDRRTILLLELISNSARYIVEDQEIVCCTLSEDNQCLLVGLRDERIRLWNIAGGTGVLNEFRGHKRARFVVRPCFGGIKEKFIASGSEDSQVYIWHRKQPTPISKLAGHTGAVNCVSWNPADPQMLASGSDDRTIRIWGVKRANLDFQKQQLPNP
ncbi:WD repeat-containing protein 26-like [Dorcoceras hygrometricum]|uniref:WD repeat-containing protein 26-like n=1 Tax=Dorcoceras hygrometricum TaxID=472368 RepID=A0A2Z7A5A5_9LAMI|nr:WD repeat-containing protein 26-like [Dorcoceras hygrometricum]